MKDIVNIKAHMAKQIIGKSQQSKQVSNVRVYYELKDTYVIKVTQVRGVQNLEALTYAEFNQSIELINNGSDEILPVTSFPLNTRRVTIEGNTVVYLIDLAKPYMPLFKRKFLKINGVEIKERVYGQKQEMIKCELTYNIDTNNVEGIKIYNNEGTTYPALESRAMGLTRFISLVDSKRFIVWSYLMSTVRLDEPELLNVVERGDSLTQYQGERGQA